MRRNGWYRSMIAIGGMLAGCPIALSAEAPRSISSTQPVESVASTASGGVSWRAWGTSVEGRSIEIATLGQGDWRLLVVAGLRGDDQTSIALVERWAVHLSSPQATPRGATITLVRDANPDGRARRQRANAHGVELDHNFSASNWRKLPSNGQWLSGRLPESEPETRALSDLIVQQRPDAVLVLEDTDIRPVILSVGAAPPWLAQLSYDTKLKIEPDSIESSGSLASFAADRQAQAVVLQLPRHDSVDVTWDRHRRALFTLVQQAGAGAATVAESGAPAMRPSPQVVSSTNPLGPSAPRWERRTVGRQVSDTSNRVIAPRAPIAGSQPPASGARILSADDLQTAQPLVPVVTPRAEREAATHHAPQNATPSVPRPAIVEPDRPGGLLHTPIRRLPAVTPQPTAPYQSRQQRPSTVESQSGSGQTTVPGFPMRPGTDRLWPQRPIPIYPRTDTP